MVGMEASGEVACDGRSATGISTSMVPTGYGPVYVGKEGIGLR